MSLKHGDPPPGSLEALAKSWLALGTSEIGGADRVAPSTNLAAGAVSNLLPHKLYTAGLATLAESGLALALREIGWRYLMNPPDSRSIAAAEVNDLGGSHEFAGVTSGPFVEATAAEVARLAEDPDVGVGDYELQALVVPAAHLFALWLRAQHGRVDIFVPLAPAPRGFTAGRKYSSEQFEGLLQQLARRRLAETPVDGPDDHS